ncbi:MAG: 23S rRNA (guanosine(2251)-2'-O)-methyltransferase RlmB [Bacteroidetes bacterium]|jgi:23S rRNA (guanosine2251-2'-O)-methyltransferase|nr:23S rRNA (guanosine(2251)-2'-O)-methyltransferase RlmB [Bacteroidota bacterium]MBK9542822.1 23S rRNA (guanosine(2251)-2'-O)-methyltransferase RlmB [Bacteroidota bacterium]MBL0258291.1 23S rRNA (guanosine(2251)-2'-O)-methyltransferase RlmB [Bacteroidota bacterium]MBP6401086.1 23S rRNA (guanosine(2251)-2'-O)-methyltransferase RlmB [Bacteroidia bacterium]MBP6648092.1 23S rRNA (guanosine(2251)-2'-O)-methyltransferase RlmB [Bacteroidia bacterium]
MKNPSFKEKNPSADRDDDQMIYGLRPVMEALEAGKEIDRIFIGRGAKGELMVELKNQLRERSIAWTEVPPEKLNRFTRKNHQEVVCFISAISYFSLSQVVPSLFEKGVSPFLLILDRITDVRNFGAIARTAECAGVHAIVIPTKGAAQVSSDAIRTSAGALSRIPVCRENNLKAVVSYLQQSGIQVVSATEKGTDFHFQADLSGPLAIVMGSEEDGVSPELIRSCDRLLRIPMIGAISSLNVSVACGIMLYEAIRQRMKSDDIQL